MAYHQQPAPASPPHYAPPPVEGAYTQPHPHQAYPQGYAAPPNAYPPNAYGAPPNAYGPPGGVYVPGTVIVVTQSETPWITGPCDCCDDMGTCCLGLFCPCIAVAYIHNERQGKEGCDGCTCFLGLLAQLLIPAFGVFGWGCCAAYYGSKRSEVRNSLGVQGNGCEDCLLHCVWQPCALTQERLEITKRRSQGPPGQAMAVPGYPQGVQLHNHQTPGKTV